MLSIFVMSTTTRASGCSSTISYSSFRNVTAVTGTHSSMSRLPACTFRSWSSCSSLIWWTPASPTFKIKHPWTSPLSSGNRTAGPIVASPWLNSYNPISNARWFVSRTQVWWWLTSVKPSPWSRRSAQRPTECPSTSWTPPSTSKARILKRWPSSRWTKLNRMFRTTPASRRVLMIAMNSVWSMSRAHRVYETRSSAWKLPNPSSNPNSHLCVPVVSTLITTPRERTPMNHLRQKMNSIHWLGFVQRNPSRGT